MQNQKTLREGFVVFVEMITAGNWAKGKYEEVRFGLLPLERGNYLAEARWITWSSFSGVNDDNQQQCQPEEWEKNSAH